MNMRSLLARRVGGLKPSSIRALNPLMRLPGMISLGGGYPNAQTFAISSLEVVFKSGRRFTIRDRAMDLACQYGPTDAHVDLRPQLITWHTAKDGVDLKEDQIQELSGAQEGLHTMAYLFLDHGDCVALSEPAYPGALGAFRAFTERFIPIPEEVREIYKLWRPSPLFSARRLEQDRPSDDISVVVLKVTPLAGDDVRRMTVRLPIRPRGRV